LQVVGLVEGKRAKPDARLFAGSGKAEEIGRIVRDAGATLVIFNHELSPVQERNLERLLECRVLDRTALILDIFALRARSNEGKLQVELAQLRHYATRWCAVGLTWNGKRAVSACAAVRVKASWSWIAVCC
jgi:GTPase